MEIHLESILLQLNFYRIGITNSQQPLLNGLQEDAGRVHNADSCRSDLFLEALVFRFVCCNHPSSARGYCETCAFTFAESLGISCELFQFSEVLQVSLLQATRPEHL